MTMSVVDFDYEKKIYQLALVCDKALAVIALLDALKWKEVTPTAAVIYDLRDALKGRN